ncbi:DUF262 domain-containing protein [Tenacibaculum aquimarinum]|uniref:DUF262 domain-containing protein n=1 Tax=Tenacibaculum aquimarinum TaxID=2910675 RepID=UPI001F0B16F6|nr:DUF262 domain-containing protein [Tenacibaculum aquimarinum]MCH3885666.1 DUF262 domain-containing HNH endonuclease family protein [Tenacibaculum aquimarinum]
MAIEVTGKQIASDKITIKDVFAEDMWFSIPDYQRPYVWGEDQISSLLDDVAHSAINTPDSQYFLGSLVLHTEPKQNGNTNYQENSVLDGQQRLTTLYLLQVVVRDLATDSRLKSTCAKAIFQEGNPYDGIPERLRIEFAIRKEVEEFINAYIKKEGGTLKKEELLKLVNNSKNVSVRNMANAILIIIKWFTTEENLNIDTFFPYLRQYVILVYVSSSELEDAYRLFTVLNDRGIKLRNSDILKAQNLKEVSTETKKAEYAKYWEELEGELEEDFDLFLSYIRTILVKEKARHNLLKEFDDNIYNPKKYNYTTKKQEKASALLKRGDETFDIIKKYKTHFDVIFSGNNHHIDNNWAFDNLVKVMQDTALSDIWVPPLLVYRENFGEDKIFDFLILLDNKFSGDWIARETPTTRIEGMNAIIKKIEEINALADLSKEEKIKLLFEDGVFTFNSANFLLDIEEHTIYGRRFARYILRKIDFLLDAPLYSEKRSSYNEMSVEHILPQNPQDTSQWVQDFTPEEREEWTHKLGNLVLISRRKNSGQGRLDFSLKKAKYFNNSIESFPNSLQIMQKDQWTIDELKANHAQLIQKIKSHYKI